MDKKLKIDKFYFSVSKSFDETETKELISNPKLKIFLDFLLVQESF